MSQGEYVSVHEARTTMVYWFGANPELRKSYQDNIAMFLYDHCGMTDKAQRDAKADHLIELIFGSRAPQTTGSEQ